MAYAAPSTRGTRSSSEPPVRAVGSRAPKGPVRPAPAPKRATGTFLAGLGIGLAVGAAVSLLLAPRSGAETRRALRNRGTRVRNKAGDAWEDLRIEIAKTTRALRRKRRDAKLAAQPKPDGE